MKGLSTHERDLLSRCAAPYPNILTEEETILFAPVFASLIKSHRITAQSVLLGPGALAINHRATHLGILALSVCIPPITSIP